MCVAHTLKLHGAHTCIVLARSYLSMECLAIYMDGYGKAQRCWRDREHSIRDEETSSAIPSCDRLHECDGCIQGLREQVQCWADANTPTECTSTSWNRFLFSFFFFWHLLLSNENNTHIAIMPSIVRLVLCVVILNNNNETRRQSGGAQRRWERER